ncbi:MAG: hypothetical protein WC547_09615, partial [Candidatus Omnitrophota bacterium]
MKALKENLIAILLKNNVLSQEQLEKALKIQTERQMPLRRVLVDEKIIGEDQLLQFLSTHLYIPSLHLSKYKFDPEIVKLIPAHMAQQYTVIPISRI